MMCTMQDTITITLTLEEAKLIQEYASAVVHNGNTHLNFEKLRLVLDDLQYDIWNKLQNKK